jgi:hypothetical protein
VEKSRAFTADYYVIESLDLTERRIMSNYIESELQRIIAIAERNEKISPEYAFRFFRIFLTAAEAKEILEIIQFYRDYHVVLSKAAI